MHHPLRGTSQPGDARDDPLTSIARSNAYPVRVALYRLEDPGPLNQPSIVVALDGWVDAGASATTAAALVGADGNVVATFDADRLFDYRARLPVLEIADGRLSELTWPEFVIRLVRIDDRDILVLTGPEPDYRWPRLAEAVVEVATTLGVTEWISLGAIPAAVPHRNPAARAMKNWLASTPPSTTIRTCGVAPATNTAQTATSTNKAPSG